MNARIYLSSPDVGGLEEAYLLSAFRSGWIAPLGPDVDLFEAELAERIGTKHAVVLSSGTAALHLALIGHGIEPGDVVLTSSMTFAATANAITYTGAKPFFIDSDETGNMDPELLSSAARRLAAQGRRPAAIVPVDLFGRAVDYSSITLTAERYGVPVIADAAESLGASHAGIPTGAWGDTAIFSFNGNKIMTTSGGGALMTSNGELANKVRYLATQARQPVVHYEHLDVGYNYRLSNLLAAVGRAQLSRLDEMMARRRLVREFYRHLFRGVPGVSILGGPDDAEDNCWLTSIVVNSDVAGWSAEDLRRALAEENIESRPLWKPMHLQPVFSSCESELNGVSEKLFQSGLTLPSGSVLSAQELERIEEAVATVVPLSKSPSRTP